MSWSNGADHMEHTRSKIANREVTETPSSLSLHHHETTLATVHQPALFGQLGPGVRQFSTRTPLVMSVMLQRLESFAPQISFENTTKVRYELSATCCVWSKRFVLLSRFPRRQSGQRLAIGRATKLRHCSESGVSPNAAGFRSARRDE